MSFRLTILTVSVQYLIKGLFISRSRLVFSTFDCLIYKGAEQFKIERPKIASKRTLGICNTKDFKVGYVLLI